MRIYSVCFYAPLGGADARNEGEALRAAPPCDPPWHREFFKIKILIY